MAREAARVDICPFERTNERLAYSRLATTNAAAFDRRASLRARESDIRQSQAQSRNQWIKPVAAQTRCGPGYQTCKLNKAVSIHVRLISSPTAPPAPPAAAAKNGRGW